MNKVKSQIKQINLILLVHFEEAYLNHIQSTPRESDLILKSTSSFLSKDCKTTILVLHKAKHIFDVGRLGVHFRSWSFQERRPPKVRPPDHGPASLPPCAHLEAPNCQQGPPGLPVLSSCHWHFHPCSITLGRMDHDCGPDQNSSPFPSAQLPSCPARYPRAQ